MFLQLIFQLEKYAAGAPSKSVCHLGFLLLHSKSAILMTWEKPCCAPFHTNSDRGTLLRDELAVLETWEDPKQICQISRTNKFSKVPAYKINSVPVH